MGVVSVCVQSTVRSHRRVIDVNLRFELGVERSTAETEHVLVMFLFSTPEARKIFVFIITHIIERKPSRECWREGENWKKENKTHFFLSSLCSF